MTLKRLWLAYVGKRVPTRINNKSHTNPTSTPKRNLEGTARACVWMGPKSTLMARQLIQTAISARDSRLVKKVKYIIRVQTSRLLPLRFDLYCEANYLPAIIGALREFVTDERPPGWIVRTHMAYDKRRKDRPRKPANNVERDHLTVMAQNVRGLLCKSDEVAYCGQECGADILLLQETLRSETSAHCQLPGYIVLGEQFRDGTGRQGVLVALRKGMLGAPLDGFSNPYIQWVQVFRGTAIWIFGSLYLPSGTGCRRNEAKKQVGMSIKLILDKFPRSPVVIGGDYNVDQGKLRKLMDTWKLDLALVAKIGDPATRSQGSKYSELDHFVVNDLARLAMGGTETTILRSIAYSDHWPIRVKFECSKTAIGKVESTTPAVPKIDAYKVRELGPAFANHQKFKELKVSMDTTLSGLGTDDTTVKSFIDDMTTLLMETVSSTAIAEELTVSPRKHSVGATFPRALVRLIAAKAKAGKRYLQARFNAEGSTEIKRLRDAFVALSTKVRQCIMLREKHRAQKSSEKATGMYLQGTTVVKEARVKVKKKLFWDWLRTEVSKTGKAGTGGKLYPVYNDACVLQTSQVGISDAWKEYFQRLLTDNTGVPRNEEAWEQRISPGTANLSELPRLNEKLTMAALNSTMRSMNNWKAAGLSQQILELFKYTLVEDTDETMSPLGAVLLKLLQMMLESGYFAKPLIHSHLVTVPKKGDLSDRKNYRGISLTETIAKILHTIIARRIDYGMATTKRYARTQAGFRRGEEALMQVITLYDLCIRRREIGKATYLNFLDLVKAYDMVPHMAMLVKARRMGVQGKVLELLKTILGSATLSVVDPTVRFRLDRGLGQGWPESTVLFNIFVDDTLEGAPGVPLPNSVEVNDANDNNDAEVVVTGLQYADDVVGVSEDIAGLTTSLQLNDAWAEVHGQKFGADCGLMCVSALQGTEPADVQVSRDAAELEGKRLALGGVPVPVVCSYKYLGVVFTADLTLEAMIRDRVSKSMGKAMMVAPVLSNNRYPLDLRRAILLSYIQPSLTYAGELLGMRAASLTAPLQKVQDMALGMLLDGREKYMASGSATALMIELGLPPVAACMAALRARAYAKYSNASTLVSSLYSGNQQEAKGWAKGSKVWLERYGPDLAIFNELGKAYLKDKRMTQFNNFVEVPPKMLGKKVKWTQAEAIWRRAYNQSTIVTRYIDRGYRETRMYTTRTAEMGSAVSVGYQRILQMRCGGFLFGRLAAHKYKAGYLLDNCCCCEQAVEGGERIDHILISCPAWAGERVLMTDAMASIRSMEQEQGTLFEAEERTTLLLGGTVGGFTLGNLWAFGEDLGDGKFGTPMSFQVASFLSTIDRVRKHKLYAVLRAASLPTGTTTVTTYDMDPILADEEPELDSLLEAPERQAAMQREASPADDPLLIDDDVDPLLLI